MIKRVLGVVCTLLIIATIILASLQWGNYSSMVFKRQNRVEPVREAVVEQVFVEEQSEQVDSIKKAQRPKKKANPNAKKKSNPNAKKKASAEGKKKVNPEGKKKVKRTAEGDEQQPKAKAKKRVAKEQN